MSIAGGGGLRIVSQDTPSLGVWKMRRASKGKRSSQRGRKRTKPGEGDAKLM